MSCYIKKSELTGNQKERILADLLVKPIEKKTYNANKSYYKEETPAKFYIVDEFGIYLPYAYSAGLLNRHINHEKKYPEINLTFTAVLRENQIPVYSETINFLKKSGTIIIKVPPGFGKTMLGSKLIVDSHLKAVVILHRELLINQWLGTFRESIKEYKVWVVGAEPEPTSEPDIIITMNERVDNIPKKLIEQVGIVIIDEAHCFCTEKMSGSILKFSPKYVIAETATPNPGNGMGKMINLLCGNNMVERIIDKEFSVVKYETGIEHETVQNKQGGLDWSFLLKKVIECPIRNQMIVDIVDANKNNKILILTARADHVRILKGLLVHEKVDTFFGNKKTYNDSRILIGTMSKIGTGFDEKNACDDFNGVRIDLVILATSIKDESLLEQNVGRGFRSDSPVIYDLVDKNKVLQNHYYCRKKWYDSVSGTITILKSQRIN